MYVKYFEITFKDLLLILHYLAFTVFMSIYSGPKHSLAMYSTTESFCQFVELSKFVREPM